MTQIIQQDHRWVLSGDVSVGTVNSILLASQQFSLADETLVDFAAVSNIDTSAVSLMLEWQRRAKRENRRLTFVNLPANLVSLQQLYGVAAILA